MSNPHTEETHGQAVVKKYESYGSLYGLGLGILAGVLISGPYFHERSFVVNMGVIACCAIGGTVIGYFAGSIATGSQTGGGVGIGADGGHVGGDGGESGGDGGAAGC